MLVAFYKDFEAKETEVKTIKFADRIWVNEKGGIECHRETFLELISGSLRKVFMLTTYKDILELQDTTDTFLIEDYPDNKRHSGEYKLINQEKRSFSVDRIDNIYALPIKSLQSSQVRNCSYIEVIFDQEVEAHAICALKLKFRINSVSEKRREDHYLLSLSYFHGRECEDECRLLDIAGREIKAITILDMKTKKGGFDVLVHLPYGAKNIAASEHVHRSYSKMEPTGNEGENRSQCIWHMREFFGDEVGKEIGLNRGQCFSVEYSMVSVDERVLALKEDVENIKNGNKNLQTKVRRGAVLQIISLILATCAILLSIILYVFSS